MAKDGPLCITIVDREAEQKRESLSLGYPQLAKTCQLIPVQMEIRSPEFKQAEFLFDSKGRCNVTRVYICLDDDSKALGAALSLRQRTMKQ